VVTVLQRRSRKATCVDFRISRIGQRNHLDRLRRLWRGNTLARDAG